MADKVRQALAVLNRQLNEVKADLGKRRLMIDFETRSEADLKEVGAWIYSKHPSTEILIATWQFQDERRVHLWRYGDPLPVNLIEAAQDESIMLNAFNSFFEYCIWQHVASRAGWGVLKGPHRFLDVQDKCHAMALPGSLDDAARVMKLGVQKDKEGKRLIQKFSKPRRGKQEGFHDPLAPENEADFDAFCKYGMTDTKVQVALDQVLPDLMPKEQLTAFMTNEMNERGVHVNLPVVKAAERLALKLKDVYNARASKLSGGLFEKCTQRAKVKDWLEGTGLTLKNMQSDTIDATLRDNLDLTTDQRNMLEWYKIAGSTSVAKFAKMVAQTDSATGRIHELLAYHRAKSGRYGGKGIQIQNLPRPMLPKDVNPLEVCESIKTWTISELEQFASSHNITPMQVLISIIRTVLQPLVGNVLRVGDYEQIEARMVMWAAQDIPALQIFHRGEDIYLYTASGLYHIPYENLNKESPERPMSKAVTLGATYNMGWKRLMGYVEDYGLSIDAREAKRIIKEFRKTYQTLPILWEWLDRKAIAALLSHFGKNVPSAYRVTHKKFAPLNELLAVNFYVRQYGELEFLVMEMPNTKRIYYPNPRIVKGKFGGFAVACDGVRDGAGFGGWGILDYYGGRFCENLIQGMARELLIAGGLMLRAAGYKLVLSVHDEWASEDDEDFGTDDDFKALMGYLPKWAKTVPMDVDYYKSEYYKK